MGSSTLRGAAWMTLAGLMYTVTGAVVRHLADDYSVFEVGFFRSIVAVAILLPAICGFSARRVRDAFRTERFAMHLLRTGLSYVAIMMWFYGVSRIPLSDYYALQFLTPLFTMAGAALLLGESSRLGNWLAVIVGFAGAMVIVRPGFAEVGLGTFAALGAALVFASVNNTARVLSRTDSTTTIVAWGNLLLIPLSLAPALPGWVTPTWHDLPWLCCVGVTGTVAQYAITRAVATAEARVIQPLDFIRLPFAAALGWIAFGESSDPWTWTGAAIIFAAATYVLRAERK